MSTNHHQNSTIVMEGARTKLFLFFSCVLWGRKEPKGVERER